MRRFETGRKKCFGEGQREREREHGHLRNNRLREREKEERCATKQNLSRSLSSAITVETSLFLSLFSLPPVFALLRLERGNQRE